MDAKDPKYSYERFGSTGVRAGQASLDLLKDRTQYTAEDILTAYAPDYVKHFEEAVNEGKKKYKSPFCVFVLTKKEPWAENVVRNWFIPRQTVPSALESMHSYPNHLKTAYKVDALVGDLKVLWSLPSYAESTAILRQGPSYDQTLVNWILDCFSGALDRDIDAEGLGEYGKILSESA